MRARVYSFAILLLMATAACGDTPTSPTTATHASPVTETFSSLLSVGGTATRSVVVAERGTIAATLAATSPASVVLGLGVGIPRKTGNGCTLTTALNTAAATTPQISIVADPGEYCVQVFDLGTLRDQAAFTITIVHP